MEHWCRMGRLLDFLLIFSVCPAVLLQEARAELNPLTRPVNYLGVEIHKGLSFRRGNVFFSPVSISAALGMLFYGARGSTAQNMRSSLGYQSANLTGDEIHAAYRNLMKTFNEEPVEDYHLYMANAALIQDGYPILSTYKTGISDIYQATVKEVHSINKSSIAREINDWVKEKTRNEIDDFIKENQLDGKNPLILLNAVYFKGTWETKFQSGHSGAFFNQGLESKKTEVHFMELLEDLPYARAEDKHLQVVELPYKGEHISMIILLPDSMDGLSQLEQNLTPDTFRDLRQRTSKTKIYLSFPKFQLQFKKELTAILRGNLGLDIFGNHVDLSGISPKNGLKLSKVFHKACIKVNEKGTVAAATTSVIFMPMSSDYATFVTVNHPFLFAIIDVRSNMILFMGRVNNL